MEVHLMKTKLIPRPYNGRTNKIYLKNIYTKKNNSLGQKTNKHKRKQNKKQLN